MNRTIRVGTGDFTYRLVPDWPRIPDGLDLGDVADVQVDGRGDVHLLSRAANAIVVLDAGGDLVRLISYPHEGTLHGITLGSDRSLWCTDSELHVVVHLDQEGGVLGGLGVLGVPSDTGAVLGKHMSVKRGAGPFNRPTATALDSSGDIFVSDGYGNARIHRFTRDGRLVDSWGSPGQAPGQFRLPHSIALARDEEEMVVADRENSRLQFLGRDGSVRAEWTDVCRPNRVALDAFGNVFVAELGLRVARAECCDGIQFPPVGPGTPGSRVSVFSPEGALLARWGGSGEVCGPGEFYSAHGLAVDDLGSVYVAQVSRRASLSSGRSEPVTCHTVQKFEPVTAPHRRRRPAGAGCPPAAG
ncbi:hypothetical protein [Pseudonocardia sp.]|jgi:hypothetical protein|uniref:hypothetical protein n=1 Tax=Pseudonocardia sp. TaxID=60912 RepID=UPI003D0F5746